MLHRSRAPHTWTACGTTGCGLHHALSAIGAAVVGVIANLALRFALSRFFTVSTRSFGPVSVTVPDTGSLDPAAVALSLVAAVLDFRLRWSTLRVLVVCAGLGAVASLVGVT